MPPPPLIDRFTMTPDPATAGTTETICFQGTASTSSPITVTLTDGGGHGTTVQITLNAEHYGCTTFTVPLWNGVIASHPESLDHAVLVL